MSHRCKVLRISPHVLVSMFSEGLHIYDVIEDGLPADAQIVAVGHELINSTSINLLVSSDTFDEVGEGQPWPEIDMRVFSAEVDRLIADRWNELK